MTVIIFPRNNLEDIIIPFPLKINQSIAIPVSNLLRIVSLIMLMATINGAVAGAWSVPQTLPTRLT